MLWLKIAACSGALLSLVYAHDSEGGLHSRPLLVRFTDSDSLESAFGGEGGLHSRPLLTSFSNKDSARYGDSESVRKEQGAEEEEGSEINRRAEKAGKKIKTGVSFLRADADQLLGPARVDTIFSSTHDQKFWIQDSTKSFPTKNLTFAASSSRPAGANPVNVVVTPNDRLQEFVGWGAAISDATAFTLDAVKTKNETQYWEILHMLFDTSEEYIAKGRAGCNLARVPLSSSDFALEEYTFCDTVDGSPDPDLKNFNINKSPKVWTTLKDIQTFNSDMKYFVAPWSQPAWMKENQVGDLIGSYLPDR